MLCSAKRMEDILQQEITILCGILNVSQNKVICDLSLPASGAEGFRALEVYRFQSSPRE